MNSKVVPLIIYLILTISMGNAQNTSKAQWKDFAYKLRTVSTQNFKPERLETLHSIAEYVFQNYSNADTATLLFICTHNSRRSQFCQVWANAAAKYFELDLDRIKIYSGGTEVTACHPNTVSALERIGFHIKYPNFDTLQNNQVYEVYLDTEEEPLRLYSKKFTDTSIPTSGFCAIPVCSSADESCPIIHGADLRVYHGYEDPKKYDQTSREEQSYDECNQLIAKEMMYIFKTVASKLKK